MTSSGTPVSSAARSRLAASCARPAARATCGLQLERLRRRAHLGGVRPAGAKRVERELVQPEPARRADQIGSLGSERVVRDGIERHRPSLVPAPRSVRPRYKTACERIRLRRSRGPRHRRRQRDRRSDRRVAAHERRTGGRARHRSQRPPRGRSSDSRRRDEIGGRRRRGRTGRLRARGPRHPRLLGGSRRRLGSRRRHAGRGMAARVRDQLRRHVLLQPRGGTQDDRARLRTSRQRRLDRRQGRQPECLCVLGEQGRRDRNDQVDRQGGRRFRRARELHRTGRDRHTDPRSAQRGAHRLHAAEDPAREGRPSRKRWPT